MTSGITWFNALTYNEAQRALSRCCQAPSFVAGMLAARPCTTDSDLLDAASRVLAGLPDDEIDAVLAGFPRIGELPADEPSELELTVASVADPATLAALARANDVYRARFGRTYLAFAAGGTRAELLAVLEDRLSNDDETEREISRAELGKIATQRLEHLLHHD
ncbi:MAG: 2-oxo-4-hydroxy-4-carboxy-5-ureidoimidazoline decarboxylase [Mycobacteriaceae bacterium]|nr:2-oxo-4-hydroxy-4-carboxy-5-ureidoimidazoline decarboxylase [Mycobacteriaceae bacterium]